MARIVWRHRRRRCRPDAPGGRSRRRPATEHVLDIPGGSIHLRVTGVLHAPLNVYIMRVVEYSEGGSLTRHVSASTSAGHPQHGARHGAIVGDNRGTRSCPITVVAIDEHPIVLRGLELQVEHGDRDISVIGTFSSVPAFLESGHRPDLVMLDPILNGADATAGIPALVGRGLTVLVYTGDDRPVPLRAAVDAGAAGILLKTDPIDAVLDAIEAAAAGDFSVSGPGAQALIADARRAADLSDQQRQVLQCIDEGLDYRATGKVMGITANTVKEYLARIRDKYREIGVKPGNAHHLTRLAKDEGHLP